MTENKSHEQTQKQLQEYLEKRNDILANIAQLEKGDDTGIVYMREISDTCSKGDRILDMIDKQKRDLKFLHLDLIEYCRVAGIKNPLIEPI